MFEPMVRVAALAIACLALSCGGSRGRPEPKPDLWLSAAPPVPDAARRIEITRSTGSCWGVDSRTKQLDVLDDRVLLHASGRPSLIYPTSWWRAVRADLNRGIRASTRARRPGYAACAGRPNFRCSFTIQVDSRPPITGCCTTAQSFEVFDSFKWLFDDVDLELQMRGRTVSTQL